MLARVRIVLVETAGAANIGAAARAMANMGLRDLVLVTPKCDPFSEPAVEYAAHGADVLQSARLVESIPDALTGCIRSYASSAKSGMYHRQAVCSPADAARQACLSSATGRVAFAFGPERTGFTLPELLHFDALITIPADERYPVLNVAAAVLIVCYELRRTVLAAGGATADPSQSEPLADDVRKRVMFEKLTASLEQIGFFRGQQSPEHLRFALRRILGRVPLSVNETDILIGMAQQIGWYAQRYGPREQGGMANSE